MNPSHASAAPIVGEIPVGNAAGFKKYIAQDLLSGLLVFFIALPLCLAIANASGYPTLAGIFTAIIGSILTTFLSNSELTIKGPAAGLIPIVLGCVAEFGGTGILDGEWSAADASAYRAALAVGATAAALQIAFALFRGGVLGEFFPTSVVHGMLAAIGIIIMIKQIPQALGILGAKGSIFEMTKAIPDYVRHANPAIAAIGLVSLAIMFGWPSVRKRVPALQKIPAQLVVLIVAVIMGSSFDLLHKHPYEFQSEKYQLTPKYLVDMPKKPFGMFEMTTPPDFSALQQPMAWKWVFMFFAVGTLESMLSAKAIDSLDPWKRKTNLNRDTLAVGVANLASACVGGLPMISEIVRSKANVDNGARTRFADMWHGLFLLVCVALIPTVLHRIPVAALAAMLIYTGSRLAHYNEFLNVFRIGKEQLLIFVVTIFFALYEDLLVGVAAGIIVKLLIHFANGVPLRAMFKPYLEIQDVDENTSRIVARGSAVFSNWIPFRRQLQDIGLVQRRNIVVDLADVRLVDHSVMEKLEELQAEFQHEGLQLTIAGLEAHRQLSPHALAARKQGLPTMSRVTVYVDARAADAVAELARRAGATAVSSVDCRLLAPHATEAGGPGYLRIEIVTSPATCQELLGALRREPRLGGGTALMVVDTVKGYGEALATASWDAHSPAAPAPV